MKKTTVLWAILGLSQARLVRIRRRFAAVSLLPLAAEHLSAQKDHIGRSYCDSTDNRFSKPVPLAHNIGLMSLRQYEIKK